jgi:hypothetical protein
MAIARDTTAANVKPLQGAIVRRFTAGAAIAAGEIVSMQSDGYVDPSDSTSAAQQNVGVALAAAAAAGDRVDVVVFGPVVCVTGATPAAAIYNSTTAGEPSESTAGNQSKIGWAESATVVFVNVSV